MKTSTLTTSALTIALMVVLIVSCKKKDKVVAEDPTETTTTTGGNTTPTTTVATSPTLGVNQWSIGDTVLTANSPVYPVWVGTSIAAASVRNAWDIQVMLPSVTAASGTYSILSVGSILGGLPAGAIAIGNVNFKGKNYASGAGIIKTATVTNNNNVITVSFPQILVTQQNCFCATPATLMVGANLTK